MNQLLSELLLGLYLGLLAALFPALIAFSIGFTFKYVTDVTVPGFGVVVLGGALAGISGGLMGLIDPEIADNLAGMTAIAVILMACLWAHSVGDKLAIATPRKLTLESIRSHKLSTDVLDRVDNLGRVRVTVAGEVDDIEGYPPLPEALREEIRTDDWKLPADRSLAELEAELTTKLLDEHELAEVTVRIDRKGKARIAAAPSIAGLSRRVPEGMRAVSIETLVPTGVARGDLVTVRLPDGDVSGPVVSARTHGAAPEEPEPEPEPDAEEATGESKPRTLRRAPTTTGGEGQVTIACSLEESRRLLAEGSAPTVVRSRGSRREYEAIGILRRGENRFEKLAVSPGSVLDGSSLGTAKFRTSYGVAVLAVRRAAEVITVPREDVVLQGGDELIVVGRRGNLRSFAEAVA
ncbi:TrkA C-terminal domain-containing protein [Halovivax sp.]|uniref:TrkA C-terminal domain-containing protein n=1 Tax=Halovivax sp. TaxID=1935978 RepID=UPI0025BC7CA6|nr:TrkA C-terminal domain-containing protein [Halovivax sp.]